MKTKFKPTPRFKAKAIDYASEIRRNALAKQQALSAEPTLSQCHNSKEWSDHHYVYQHSQSFFSVTHAPAYTLDHYVCSVCGAHTTTKLKAI